MHILAAVVSGLIGFVVGAFLQTVVRRTPMRERVIGIGMHCATCGTRTHIAQSFPLFSYATGANRCTCCKQRIWTKLPWLEVVAALAFAGTAFRFGWAWALPAYLVTFAAFIAIAVIDLRHYIIPNRVVYPALVASLVIFTAAALVEGRPQMLLHAFIGMTVAWAMFFVVWLVYPRGLGFGDVRLAALIGLVTGWLGVFDTIIAVFLGVASGAVVGLGFVFSRILTRRDPIPYGPFLILGAVVSIFWGHQISEWWLGTS